MQRYARVYLTATFAATAGEVRPGPGRTSARILCEDQGQCWASTQPRRSFTPRSWGAMSSGVLTCFGLIDLSHCPRSTQVSFQRHFGAIKTLKWVVANVRVNCSSAPSGSTYPRHLTAAEHRDDACRPEYDEHPGRGLGHSGRTQDKIAGDDVLTEWIAEESHLSLLTAIGAQVKHHLYVFSHHRSITWPDWRIPL
jgi:hypothetical protein